LISGRLQLMENLTSVCHESIYQFIYKEAPDLIQHLPRKHRRRRKKHPYRKKPTKIALKTCISLRPEPINNRSVAGHWESDSVESKGHKQGCNVLVERKTRLKHITKLESKKAGATQKALLKRLSTHPDNMVSSITYDNGSENAKHLIVNDKLGCDSYFCQPYHSWEKGTVEQTIGLVRRFFPKGTDFTQVSSKRLLQIESLLNNRPRKCLGFKTPLEAYNEFVGALTL